MKILLVGLNHKTAPVDIRERLAFNEQDTTLALQQLKDRFHQVEFVLLSTCNRVELYCAGKCGRGCPSSEELAQFLSDFKQVPLSEFEDFLYFYSGQEAVEHLLIVASSLDSLVVGEPQIVRQVKDSYRLACTARCTGKVLNRLFHCAFGTSKMVHTATSISRGRISVAGFAVELARQLFEDIRSAKVVVIGAGEMGELVVQHLLHEGCREIVIVNRSYERAIDKARHYGTKAGRWEQLRQELADADIVVAAAACEDYLFNKDAFQKIMQHRRDGALLIIDIAVPRNFEPAVNEIESVFLYSIDDLSRVVEENRRSRQKDIAKAREIISAKVNEFMDWLSTGDIGPLIGQMKEKFRQIARQELDGFFVGLRGQACCRPVMEAMINRLVNKLLHCVIKNVDAVAKKHGPGEAAKLLSSIVQRAEEIAAEPEEDRNRKKT